MKKLINQSVILCWFANAIFKLHAQGYIVPNGVTYDGFELGFGYRINVTQNPTGVHSVFSPTTQFWLVPSSIDQPSFCTNVFALQELTDIEVRVFLVASNDPVSLPPILSQQWPELAISSTYIFQDGVPFYVGLYTGYQFAPPYPPHPPFQYLGPVFGWAQLENVGGTIQMLGGALEYGGGGIYAGTENIINVPEPGSLAMLVAGGLLGAWGWRRTVCRGGGVGLP